MTDDMLPEVRFIDTEKEAKRLNEELMDVNEELTTFDTEFAFPMDYRQRKYAGKPPTRRKSDSPESYGCEIILSSFCYTDEFCYVVKGDLIKHLAPWFASPDHNKSGHNLMIDVEVIQYNKYVPMKFRGFYLETMYGLFLEDCSKGSNPDKDRGVEYYHRDKVEMSLGLKEATQRKFGLIMDDFSSTWGYIPEGKKKIVFPKMWDVLENPSCPAYNRDNAIKYAGLDAWTNFLLAVDIKETQVEYGYWDTYVNEDRLFLWLLWKMEKRGIRVDIRLLKDIGKEAVLSLLRNDKVWLDVCPDLKAKTSPLKSSFVFFRHEPCVSSKKTYDKEKLPVLTCGCKSPHKYFETQVGKPKPEYGWPNGVPKCDNLYVLPRLDEEEECKAAKILRLSKLASNISTNFVKRYIERCEADEELCNDRPVNFHSDVVVYRPKWKATLVTGRISAKSNNKNKGSTLQNVPAREHKDIYRIRRSFVARKGHLLIVFDYGNLEMRIIAHFSRDPVLCDAFERDIDAHSATAIQVFDLECDPDLVKKEFEEERSISKAINFGVAYGCTARTIARNTGKSVEDSSLFLKKWKNVHYGIVEYLESEVEFAKAHGYIETIAGRRRYIPDIKVPEVPYRPNNDYTREEKRRKYAFIRARNQAYNGKIQGSAADIMKRAQVSMFKDQALHRMGFKQLLQIHDELVCEAPIQHAEECMQIMKYHMVSSYKEVLTLPLVVSGSLGTTWNEAK